METQTRTCVLERLSFLSFTIDMLEYETSSLIEMHCIFTKYS